MVYKSGAFAAGQMQMVVNAGKRAKELLDARAYRGNVEKAELEREVAIGKSFEVELERHKKAHGL